MALVEYAPRFSAAEAGELAVRFYDFHGQASPLPSERDQNFLLTSTGGLKFVLKIANTKEDRALLEAQNQVMLHLADRLSLCQRIIPGIEGHLIHDLPAEEAGSFYFVRMVTYLEGVPLGKVRRRSARLLEDIGRNLGRLDGLLLDFEHPALHRDFYWDLANGLKIIEDCGPLIEDPEIRSLVEKTGEGFAERTVPLLEDVRRSIIYNDANDFNIIVGGGIDLETKNQSLVGFIDLGDMVHGYTVGDLAILLAYALLDHHDPLSAAGDITRGYHREFPLSDNEIRVLFELVKLRLAMSAAIAALQMRERQDNAYLAISQAPIGRTLPLLANIPPRFAEAVLRKSCGLEPLPGSGAIVSWMRENSSSFSPVVDIDKDADHLMVLDLSVGSPLVGSDPSANSEPELTGRIFGLIGKEGAKAAFGRYLEARKLYSSPLFACRESAGEPRTVHLGLDIFMESGSCVRAPLEGTVHAFADNREDLDYGPVIILKHVIPGERTFYTLYGHLSRESLAGLQPGRKIAQGERIAAIGTSDVNGGWTPHLHFQMMVDLLGMDTDFPGVVRPSEKEIWAHFSPDPNLLLGLSPKLFPPGPLTSEETLAARRSLIAPSLRLSYKDPVKIVRGWKQYLYDLDGRRYIDAYNNVPHVGHSHPRVVRAASDQLAVLNTNTRYLHDNIILYARRLLEFFPDPLRVCFFVNSGSEANELALRLARTATGARDLIVQKSSYHGHTTTLIDISPYKHDGPGGSGAPGWVHSVPLPDTYRGPYKKEDPGAGEKYAAAVRDVIRDLGAQGIGLSGFMAETAPSVGGQILLPPGYLRAVYGHVRRAGALCIADEVQTGYGRIGTHFWAFEEQGVVPDIVVLGKPIGNGYPIGAVITTKEIAAAFDSGMEFFSTFGGSTVSCAVGREVLEVVLEENLQAHAHEVGIRLLDGLRSLSEKASIIGDVRGSGLFLGVELVRDRTTLEPAAEEAAFVVNRMRERGVLIGTDGPYDNVLKIRPPMPFNEEDADQLLDVLSQILSENFPSLD